MIKKIVAQKLGMSQIFDKTGKIVPVTILRVLKSTKLREKNIEDDGYKATIMSVEKRKKILKTIEGIFNKLKIKPASHLYEIKDSNIDGTLDIKDLEGISKVKVIGTGKGKGFAGTIKRYGFHRGPKTHGSHNYRQPGSIGSTYPQRVIKGKKMPGRMGNEKTTIKNVDIININLADETIALKGSIPGSNDNFIYLEINNEA